MRSVGKYVLVSVKILVGFCIKTNEKPDINKS